MSHTDTAEDAVGQDGYRLDYSAISDVGRVRKDNQDSGYAGPWLLTVCDGVGGAARGDLASSTAVSQIRRLDTPPADDLLSLVGGAIHRAHDRIAELVDQDSSLNGTSTTATVALFDGHRLGVGHVGDSRAYLLRDGEMRQITADHTFVQSLIDEGRITEEEARTHPHRNLILRALDGNDADPDLFTVDVSLGDRILVCSDGVLSLDDARIADILGSGTPDFAAVELVRASLEAGTTDNVTCVVGDVVAPDHEGLEDLQPLLVGAAAELPRKASRVGVPHMFRGHRSGDTGEIDPVPGLPEDVHAIPNDPLDPEELRYAPRAPRRFTWLRRLLTAAVVIGIVWIGGAVAWSWSQQQYYVGVGDDGLVTIYRGLNAELPGVDLSRPYEATDIDVDDLPDYFARQVTDGIEVDDLTEAHGTVNSIAAQQDTSTTDTQDNG